MRTDLLRTVGAVTAVYGLLVTRRPALLAKPSGIAAETHVALSPLAWRDAVGGLAMLLAPAGPALRTAACVRLATDLGDAALLGKSLPGRPRRAGAVAVALGWSALSAAGLLAADRGENAKSPESAASTAPAR